MVGEVDADCAERFERWSWRRLIAWASPRGVHLRIDAMVRELTAQEDLCGRGTAEVRSAKHEHVHDESVRARDSGFRSPLSGVLSPTVDGP
jgi:hypothetical protein